MALSNLINMRIFSTTFFYISIAKNCYMKLKVLPLSLFLYKSHIFNSFVPIFAFINDKKKHLTLTHVWLGQDANILHKFQ